MILTDYHVHSSISPDASSSMKEMCESAIQKGLEEIAFTDHYECLDFGKPHSIFTSSYLTNYQNTLDRCQEQFSGRLTVKRGLELGQMYLTPESSKAVLSRYPWDYVIGSVHKLHNTDLSGFTFTQDNLPVIAGEYYSGLYRLAETGDFDCLGHLDLVKRHTSRFGLPDCSDLYQPAIEAILKLLIQRGKGLELNTSGFRQEPHEGYPGTSILMLYRRLGGEIITVGSDSHARHDVGADFDLALQWKSSSASPWSMGTRGRFLPPGPSPAAEPWSWGKRERAEEGAHWPGWPGSPQERSWTWILRIP